MARNILFIGGSGGIGLETIRLIADTAQVYALSRHAGPLEAMGIPHAVLDVTGGSFPEDFIPETLDGLVYCPGTISLKPFKMLSEETFREDLEINFLGLVRILKTVMPRFRDGASLVFFSTVAVRSGMPFHTSVAAAKGAIEGFARALAAETAPRLRVNVIAPSLVDTPLAGRLLSSESKREKMAERHPLKAVGTPEDIAQMAAFLLSEKSRWITGQTFGVDGGISVLNLN